MVYLINRIPTTFQFQIPNNVLFKVSPNFQFLKIWLHLFSLSWTLQQTQVMKWILRYLKGTILHVLHLTPMTSTSLFPLQAFL